MFPLISQMIFYINELTLILKIIGQCDVKHNDATNKKTITSCLNISTYIITTCSIRLSVIHDVLAMSVSTFITVVLLHLLPLIWLYLHCKLLLLH